MINKKISILLFLILLFSYSCIDNPTNPVDPDFISGKQGALILCEGLFGSDNSSITCISFADNSYTNNYFRNANDGQKLGDIANDIYIKDSLVYVAVSNSKTIEVFHLKTGKSIGRIKFPNYVMPRKFAFVNDTLAYVTTYISMSNDDFYVYEFNPKTISLTGIKIYVGSHPEGIAYYNNKLYVVNSGYGEYHSYHPKASTISLIDINSKTEIQCIPTGENPARIIASPKTNKLYVLYWGLYSEESPAGIIEYDLNTLQELRRWTTEAYEFCLNSSCDTLFYLNSSASTDNINENNDFGVNYIPLNTNNAAPVKYIKNPKQNEIWTGIALNETRNEIWIANSYRYTTNGDVTVYDRTTLAAKQTYKVGSIPTLIKFY